MTVFINTASWRIAILCLSILGALGCTTSRTRDVASSPTTEFKALPPCSDVIPELLAALTAVRDCPLVTNDEGKAIGYGVRCVDQKLTLMRKKMTSLGANHDVEPLVTPISDCPQIGAKNGSLDYKCSQRAIDDAYNDIANIRKQNFCAANR